MKVFLNIILMLVLFTGCIIVEDFGEYWQKGEVDSQIEGRWEKAPSVRNQEAVDQGIEDEELVLIRNGDHYEYPDKEDKTKLKTLFIGEHRFLMLKNPEGGALLKYSVNNDELTFYLPNIEKRDYFLSNLANTNAMLIDEGVVPHLGIKIINEDVINILKKASEQPDNFQVMTVFRKKYDESSPIKQ